MTAATTGKTLTYEKKFLFEKVKYIKKISDKFPNIVFLFELSRSKKNMSKLSRIIEAQRAKHLENYENQVKLEEKSRLHIRVEPEVIDLLARLSIITGMKRSEVLSVALKEFAELIRPDLLEDHPQAS